MPGQRQPRAPVRGIGTGREDGTSPAVSRRKRASETAIGLACAAGVVALFSSFVLVSRYGLQTSLEPVDLAFLRFSVSGLVLLPVFLRYGTGGLALPQAIVVAGLGGLGFVLLAYHGFARAPASHGSALIHGTLPAFSLLAGYVFSGHRARWPHVTGAAAIGTGVLLMIWSSLLAADASQLLGDALLLAASACWACYGLLVRRYPLPALAATALVTTCAMIGYVPAYLAVAPLRVLSLPLADILIQGAFQGLLIGVLSVMLYTRVVQALGANAAAISAAIVPAVTTLLAIPILGESPTAMTLAGVALVTGGIASPILLSTKASS